MDTPEDFIKDDIRMHTTYYNTVPLDDLIAIIHPEKFGIHHEVAKQVAGPFFEVLRTKLHNMFLEYGPQVEEIVDNPPECIEDKLLYQAVQYTTRADVPYVIRGINNAPKSLIQRFNIVIPEGTIEKNEQLKNIPLCAR